MVSYAHWKREDRNGNISFLSTFFFPFFPSVFTSYSGREFLLISFVVIRFIFSLILSYSSLYILPPCTVLSAIGLFPLTLQFNLFSPFTLCCSSKHCASFSEGHGYEVGPRHGFCIMLSSLDSDVLFY
jgi:hypothetical protein